MGDAPTRATRWPSRWIPCAIGGVAVTLIVILAFLDTKGFQGTERATIEEFKRRQQALAQEAAHAIGFYTGTLTKALRPLACDPVIQSLAETPTRRDLKLKAEELKALGVRDVAVFDAKGILRYSATDSEVEGLDFSFRPCFSQAAAARSSDVAVVEFVALETRREGARGLLLGVPMFIGPGAAEAAETPARFGGMVGCVVDLGYLGREFLETAHSSDGGYAFLIDETGTVLWCVDPRSAGKSLLEESREFPSLHALAQEMLAGRKGAAEFTYHRLDSTTRRYVMGQPQEKVAGYAPVSVGSVLWSVAVWAPRADVLRLLLSARRAHWAHLATITLVVLAASGLAIVLLSRLNRTLGRKVHEKTRELEETNVQLSRLVAQIESSRKELDAAVNQASRLIDTAARDQSMTLNYENPSVATCWRVRSCPNTRCPVHGKERVRCWQEEGTLCDEGRKTTFADKVIQCRECKVFQKSCPDLLTELSEGFNNMMFLLRRKAQELSQMRYHAIQRERMATIGQMAAGIAHEIDNPMASLFSLVQVLRASAHDEETKAQLSMMQQCIDRISKTVREIVDFGRPVRDEDWKYGDVGRIVEDTVRLLRYDRRARGVQVSAELDPGLPKTMLIEHQLQQVFVNVMINALDAMGGRGTLTVRGWRADGMIEVAITDTGVGMRPEQIQHVFEPFYTTKAGRKGTGLGLAVSYNIIQRHGGAIRVQSEAGKGATFVVSLPIRGPDGENNATGKNPGD